MILNGTKIVIKNKKRFFLFLTCISLISLIALNFIFLDKAEGYEKNALQIVTVSRGDTLWDIVSQYSSKREDIREQIYHIKIINDLETSYIYPGQQLLIPTGE
ncbi:LysM peptidoglycan-binding domain-containing protein [Irregularibacter muris]|uniref:LysM peptidoglycan-binding domain-containing protein n=1 Tax=Irregularibacter muris TaxID=1796619 RepID=A0AAE3HDH8_9FIRM|nr:LysM peptidoglycan-binding domain-containing protein [Irregularibacter muris]MCR1898076.1 LysM peptidoglycan-binding domain-containing protein [Irregularibacter muris]